MTPPESPVAAAPSTEEERLRQHYDIEKHLAARLMGASSEERRELYSSLYDELYRRVPWHPQLTRKVAPEERARMVAHQLDVARPWIRPGATYLELGPGDCAFAFLAARTVGPTGRAIGVDVSAEVTRRDDQPENFELVLSDGSSVPVPEGSVDVAYSNQLMEHLHPEDAERQLQAVFRALTPGGAYLCTTPNRLSGPHDVSRAFSDTAEGLHLQEYTTGELAAVFHAVGFTRLQCRIGLKGRFLTVGTWLPRLVEALLGSLPGGLRRSLARSRLVEGIINVRLIGHKP
ncbi:MAG: methyltransferase domain-containing protein [Planctomycetota bacterium]|nr:methyltransferase domain-containing protein [Planctomycetota bacterium]